MPTHAVPFWSGHVHAPALLRFNVLALELLDPAQRARLLPAWLNQEGATSRGARRHANAGLVRGLGLRPITGLADAALPLCLADATTLRNLVSWCGIAILGAAVRRVIARDEVAILEREFGHEGLAFARGDAAGLWAGGGGAVPVLDLMVAGAQAAALGSALLCVAFTASAPEVAGRARLRLAPDAEAAVASLPPALTSAPAALAFARSILHVLDPAWLSSFPDPR